MSQNEADIKIFKKKLQVLCNSSSPIGLPENIVQKKVLKLNLDTGLIASNPNLGLLVNTISIREKERSVEKAKVLPEFSLGYFNQSMIGNLNVNGTDQYFDASKRLQGVQATVSIPIWARPDAARIKAAKLGRQRSESDAAYYRTVLLGEYERVVQDYFKFRSNIEYYEANALPQAELILSNSKKSFENGAIDYVEYIQSLNNGITIKNNYLDLLLRYNRSIIAIEFLAGKK